MVYNLNITGAQLENAARIARDPSKITITLDSPTTTTCTLADEFYQWNGSYSATSANNFSLTTAGVLTYTGVNDMIIKFDGDATAAIGAVTAQITYALKINDVHAPGFDTPLNYTTNEDEKSLGTNGLSGATTIKNGDVIKFFVLSDTAGVTVQQNSIKLTVLEIAEG